MNKETIKTVRVEALTKEYVSLIQDGVKLEIDIAALEKCEPTLIVLREKKQDGTYNEITARGVLDRSRNELKGLQNRLSVIEYLLDQTSKA